MKIFKFNPITGKRGEQIDNVGLIEWTAESVKYMIGEGRIAPIKHNTPNDTSNAEWVTHIDAGRGDVSYLRDEWICFCQGQYFTGTRPGVWNWIVLPPKSLIIKN